MPRWCGWVSFEPILVSIWWMWVARGRGIKRWHVIKTQCWFSTFIMWNQGARCSLRECFFNLDLTPNIYKTTKIWSSFCQHPIWFFINTSPCLCVDINLNQSTLVISQISWHSRVRSKADSLCFQMHVLSCQLVQFSSHSIQVCRWDVK